MIQLLNIALLILIPLVKLSDISKSEDVIKPSEWESLKSSDGVTTYERWIVSAGNNKTRERKGEMMVESSIEEVIAILSNTKSSAVWMKNISETYDLKKISSNEWFTYTLFHIPWPFSNRDLVSNVKLQTISEKGAASINIESRENFIPSKPKTIRLTNYKANWKIKSIDKNKIKIIFTAITDEPPMFPRWIQDPIVENIFHNNLVNLKQYIRLHKTVN